METTNQVTQKLQAIKIITQYIDCEGHPNRANAGRILELFEDALGIDEAKIIKKLIAWDALPDEEIDDHANRADWQDKAEWLRVNCYSLSIESLSPFGVGNNDRWKARKLNNNVVFFSETIGGAVEQVYKWITTKEVIDNEAQTGRE